MVDSTDGGETWGEPRIAVDGRHDDRDPSWSGSPTGPSCSATSSSTGAPRPGTAGTRSSARTYVVVPTTGVPGDRRSRSAR